MKPRFWLFFAIVLFVPACTVQPILITPTQLRERNITTVGITRSTSTVTPTKTVLPTKVLPVPSATSVQPTPFIDPIPTVTPTTGPLTAEGPWLVISDDEVMLQASSGYMVMNADGTNLQPIPLQDPPENRVWRFLSEAHGPFLAFRTIPKEGAPFNIRADGFDDFVWIIKLPDNQVIRKLPLLSDAAWNVIHEAQKKDPVAFENGFEIPTQLGLVVNPDSFQWSPHGRYLTYSAALDGSGTDLYMYDTEKDVSRRLTQDRTGAQIWFWAPDGSTLFYRNGQITTVEYAMPDLAYMDGVYALDLFQGERKLYDPETWEQVINVSDEAFLVMDHGFEAIPWNLRLVNYRTGSIRTLYKGSFSSAASDLADQTILLLFDPSSPFSSQIDDKTPGIYRLNFSSGKLDFLREGSFSVHYESSASLFSTQQKTSEESRDMILFNQSGQEILHLPDSAWLLPSPDGQWIITRIGQSWKLYSINGEAKTIEEHGDVYWVKDSSGFYATSCREKMINLYEKENNWQPKVVYKGDFVTFYIVPSKEN